MAAELARVCYIEYSYWSEISGGSRLAVDAAKAHQSGRTAVGHLKPTVRAPSRALRRGERFPPLILAGPRDDGLVCLEGNLRLTAYTLAGFPEDVECLVGTAPTLARWAQ